MRGTRHAKPGSALRQERYASSPELQRGFNAVLVKLRCETLARSEDIELVWFIQYFSDLPGGLGKFVADLFAAFPDRLPSIPRREHFRREVSDLLTAFCLDPGFDVEQLSTQLLPDLHALLVQYLKHWEKNRLDSVVVTEVGRKILSGLDYAEDERTLVLVEGVYGTGKTFIARAWCEARPGKRRYIQTPSSSDSVDFFRTVATPLGVSSALSMKVRNIRVRVNAVLQAGHFSVVLDEAHYLFPQSSIRFSLPGRINWVMTALTNYQVPVILVATPQFTASQANVEKNTHWASGQFIGRIARYIKLPESLSEKDLQTLARFHLPQGDTKSIDALVQYARASKKRIRGIEHAIKSARHVARSAGRDAVTFADIKEALIESIMPSDSALNNALSAAVNPVSLKRKNGIEKIFASAFQNQTNDPGALGVRITE